MNCYVYVIVRQCILYLIYLMAHIYIIIIYIYMGQSPRKWPFSIYFKSYKNDSRLNRYNFGTINAIDFLFSRHHNIPFL